MPFYDVTGPCVYLLREEDTAMFKIGRTSLFKERHAVLERERSCKLVVINLISVSSRTAASQLEAYLHRYFAKQRVRGEWFCIEDQLSTWPDAVNAGLGQLLQAKKKLNRVKATEPAPRLFRPSNLPPTVKRGYYSIKELKLLCGVIDRPKPEPDTPQRSWSLSDLLGFLK